MDIEWLILADSAQVVGNKLYMLGGGWDRLIVNKELPLTQRLAIATSFRVPWNETNERHSFEIEIATEDGKQLGKGTGQFEIGRPVGVQPGQDQRTQIALEINMNIAQFGTFVINASVGEEAKRSFSFSVVPGPSLLASRQTPPGSAE